MSSVLPEATPLHLAALSRDLRALERLVDEGARLDAWARDGGTALGWAAGPPLGGEARAASVDWLLDHGAPLFAERGAWDLVHRAARGGHAALLQRLLDEGVDPRALDGHGLTPRDHAERAGRDDVLALLPPRARRRPTPRRGDRAGTTWLHVAAADGEVERFAALVRRHGVDPVDCAGATPLHEACRYGRRAAVEALLERGADPARRTRWEVTPVAWAASALAPAVVEALLAAGAPAHVPDLDRRTPLHRAALARFRRGADEVWGADEARARVIELLLAAGVDPGARDWDGHTYDALAPGQLVRTFSE